MFATIRDRHSQRQSSRSLISGRNPQCGHSAISAFPVNLTGAQLLGGVIRPTPTQNWKTVTFRKRRFRDWYQDQRATVRCLCYAMIPNDMSGTTPPISFNSSRNIEPYCEAAREPAPCSDLRRQCPLQRTSDCRTSTQQRTTNQGNK